MTKIEKPQPLSVLTLKRNNKPLADDYIRSYAICYLPQDFLEWEKKILPPINVNKLDGNEYFLYGFKKLDFKVIDFWRWAYSDLLNNTTRGIFAEYIVAKALGQDRNCRNQWQAYDFQEEHGLKIEVKSASYLQSWHQKNFSKIIFSIRETNFWNPNKNEFLKKEKNRWADIYVFCLFRHKAKEIANPLDLEQWIFYIVETVKLNEKLGNRKTLSLSNLLTLNPIKSTYPKLRENLDFLINKLLKNRKSLI